MISKKPYNPPLIEDIKLDKALAFLSTSEYTPPDPGDSGPPEEWKGIKSSSSSNKYEDKNNFNENPFEK